MSLDGKLLAKARDELARRRRENEAEAERRRQEVYTKNPRIREIDRKIHETMVSAIGAAIGGGDAREVIEAVREENLDLQERRGLELARMGLPLDYLDDKYMCPDCRDTGSLGTDICHCLMDIYRAQQAKELSALLKLGEETFDSFDLGYYSTEPDPATGMSPRRIMETAYETCLIYATRFSPDTSPNLFLSGAPGLGKTFLSACIARTVAQRGFSVVYETAVSALSKYDAERFGRGDIEELRGEIRRLESCDLLILDDLGTEYPTAPTVSALYTLINSRLTGGKKTVISSNLSFQELQSRYTPAIMSRLTGEYSLVKFEGTDIRRLRRERQG